MGFLSGIEFMPMDSNYNVCTIMYYTEISVAFVPFDFNKINKMISAAEGFRTRPDETGLGSDLSM